VLPAHTDDEGPVKADGATGTAVKAYTARLNDALVPHGPTARTVRLLVLYVELKLKVIVLVVELPVAPVGNVHWYEVAPATAGVVNTLPDELRQTPYEPLMAEGAEGALPAPLVTTTEVVAEHP
jgi:hypothetical protein